VEASMRHARRRYPRVEAVVQKLPSTHGIGRMRLQAASWDHGRARTASKCSSGYANSSYKNDVSAAVSASLAQPDMRRAPRPNTRNISQKESI
jgi:hypothetical protein